MPPRIALTVRSVGSVRGGCAVATGLDAALELLERLSAALQHLCARAERSEHQQRCRLGLRRGQLGPRAHRHGQAVVARPGVVLADDRPAAAVGDFVVGAQEQVFLVRVQPVEGRLRHVRELCQVHDAHGRIALLHDQLDHRVLQALALVALYELGIETVAASWQRPVASCLLIACLCRDAALLLRALSAFL